MVGDGWPHGVKPTLFGDFGEALSKDFRGTLDGFLALEALGSASAQAELRDLRAHAFERGAPAPAALLRGLELLDAFERQLGAARGRDRIKVVQRETMTAVSRNERHDGRLY